MIYVNQLNADIEQAGRDSRGERGMAWPGDEEKTARHNAAKAAAWQATCITYSAEAQSRDPVAELVTELAVPLAQRLDELSTDELARVTVMLAPLGDRLRIALGLRPGSGDAARRARHELGCPRPWCHALASQPCVTRRGKSTNDHAGRVRW